MSTTPYPFSAVVGLDDLRLALLLNAVSPAVGGVLVRGEKGTAKSTIVRALAALLPDVDVVAGCRFGCDPDQPDEDCPDGPHGVRAPAETRRARLVELPVGASEDRLVGALDLERALTEGVKAYEPGLLAAAHRGVLYVDEVNLLHDHLVDLLLDAAAMGTSHVEREGVSVRHAARFLLVGTMNPEEGELRPQLLDRFGLTVEVTGTREVAQRAEVIRRRLAYEADPAGFAARFREADAELAARITAARLLLPAVTLPDEALETIARVCAAFEVDGLRADLVTARAAVALAAWHGRTEVTRDDIRQAALLALPHRRRRNPFDAPGLDPDTLDEALGADQDGSEPEPPGGGEAPPESAADAPPADGPATGDPPAGDPPAGPPQTSPPAASGADQTGEGGSEQGAAAQGPDSGDADGGAAPAAAAAPESRADPGALFRTRLLTVPGVGEGAAGRRSRAETGTGRTTGARPPRGALRRLHLTATLRAAAPHQHARGRVRGGLLLRTGDLREAVREGREGNLVLFLVDASGSMAARQRMGAVKGAVLSLLLDAYQRRDKVGLITFRGHGAEVALPPTSSVDTGAARLRSLPTGGRTPLAAGLLQAREVLRTERLRDPRRRALLVVVTDGRATAGTGSGAGADPVTDARRAAALLAPGVAGAPASAVVVDCEDGPVRLGLAARLAADLGGVSLRLSELAADGLTALVRDRMAADPTRRVA
jgi:magnesium chelatase subunit D